MGWSLLGPGDEKEPLLGDSLSAFGERAPRSVKSGLAGLVPSSLVLLRSGAEFEAASWVGEASSASAGRSARRWRSQGAVWASLKHRRGRS